MAVGDSEDRGLRAKRKPGPPMTLSKAFAVSGGSGFHKGFDLSGRCPSEEGGSQRGPPGLPGARPAFIGMCGWKEGCTPYLSR